VHQFDSWEPVESLIQINPYRARGGAYTMEMIPDFALGLPMVALLVVLFRCELRPDEERP
jgi:hypothetical protein